MKLALLAGLGSALLLAACSTTSASSGQQSAAAKAPPERFSRDPFSSTYRIFPGAPTLVTNVTIYDGEGGRIENGSVLFAEGKIVGPGRSTEEAALGLAEGVPREEAGTPPPAAGNGSAMRAGPVRTSPLGSFRKLSRRCALRTAHRNARETILR